MELLAVVIVIALGGAYFSASGPASEARATVTPGFSATPYAGPSGRPRFGDNPCRAVLENGELNLVFDNTAGQDYHLYTGRGLGHFEVLRSKGPIVVEALYAGCAMDSVHDCYHYDLFNVPAGQTRTMHLGKAPAFLKVYPKEGPAIFRTYAPEPPTPDGAPRLPRIRPR